MSIREPKNEAEWEQYFDLRWRVLRAPWQQPKGSEKDELENSATSFHAMAFFTSGKPFGVARIQLLSNQIAQVRYMAVDATARGKGVGTALLKHLEDTAASNGIIKVILQARANAVEFYESQGYHVVEKTFILYDSIQHYLMEKKL